MVAVPALMHLTGLANWWLPGWLDRALLTARRGPAESAFGMLDLGDLVFVPPDGETGPRAGWVG